tara:strand:- start:188 stop:1090 length:903 start_codon:yes stop_codon:yes gene_type:complete
VPFNVINGVPLLFIHIPKTGGTSIKKYFDFQISGHETLQDFLYHLDQGQILLHANEEYGGDPQKFQTWKTALDDVSVELFKKSRKDNRHPFHGLFKFSFVRNPWDRATSLYYYHKEDFGRLGTFSEFINDVKHRKGKIFDPSVPTVLRLTQTQYLSIGDICDKVSQNSFIKSLTSTEQGKPEYDGFHPRRGTSSRLMIDYIGRLETVTHDVKNICQLLDAAFNGGDRYWMNNRGEFTQHERKSMNNEKRYTNMYKDFDSIYTVFDYYYDDVVNFNYTFSGTSNCEITKECFRIKAQENAS